MSSVAVCPMPLNTSDNYYACKWKCYSSIASCCFTRIRVRSTGQRMFFNCSIYIYIRKHFNWQWLSFPASHPLSPAPTCTLAFWSITSTITDYSTERAVTPPSSTSPHSHPPLTQADTVTSQWPFVFSTVVPVNCVNSVTAHMMRKKWLFLVISFFLLMSEGRFVFRKHFCTRRLCAHVLCI